MHHDPAPERWITAAELSHLTGWDPEAIWRFARLGRVPANKVTNRWRFPYPDAVHALTGYTGTEAGA